MSTGVGMIEGKPETAAGRKSTGLPGRFTRGALRPAAQQIPTFSELTQAADLGAGCRCSRIHAREFIARDRVKKRKSG